MRKDELQSIFGDRVRVRVMGVFIQNDKILMINHSGLNNHDELWMPPGGGVEVEETLADGLEREFYEEANLKVKVGAFMFGNEFILKPYHAIELFFDILEAKGNLSIGIDPEMQQNQVLKGLKFMSLSELKGKGEGKYHKVFDRFDSIEELYSNTDFFKLEKNV